MDILNHQDAQCEPDDFELPLLPAPQFLQPVHEPQIRFPSMSAPWGLSGRTLLAFRPQMTSKTNSTGSFEVPDGRKMSSTHLDSPFVSPRFRDAIPVQLGSPAIDHMSNIPPYKSAFDRVLPYMGQDDLPQGSHYLQPWEKMRYGNALDEEGISYDFQHGQLFEGDQAVPPAQSFEARHLESPRLHRCSESVTAISPHQLQAAFPSVSTTESYVLGEPLATPIGQPAIDIPPPSKKRRRKSSSVQPEFKEQHTKDSTRRRSEDGQKQLSSRSKADSATSGQTSEGSGLFIHSLCGKSFASRSKVKKHHWDIKLEDMGTTTGCWHKHRRPNIAWNDHPSCKEARRPPQIKPSRAKSMSAENKAPTVPTMVPSHRNIMEGGYLPYHTRSLPSSSPFENLLTAVNVAAKIESPVPKGRNDSVVFPILDAQAIAAECTGQYEPVWASTSSDQVSYLDPMFDQHHLRSYPLPRPMQRYGAQPTAYNNTMKQRW
jgi:hypothetical protein